jgi:hypothetical protein
MKTTNLTLMVALLAGAGCSAVQPKPQCKAQPATYAARYTVDGPPPMGMCADAVLAGEVLNLQYYRSKPEDTSATPSVAIEPQSIADAVAEGTEAKVMVNAKEYSLGKYASVEPDDNDICEAKTMSDTTMMVPEIPANTMATPPVDAIPARDIAYKWSNLRMLVRPTSNAVYFGADLQRKDGDCVIKYKVTAVSPAVFCGDAVKPVLDENGVQKKDDKGNLLTEPDPENGNADPNACKPIQGSGLNPLINYTCDIDDKGVGTHLCLPKDNFPTERATAFVP